ncbi:MAG: hypothetical protein ABSH16_13395 [Sedimentisphaerales bacterium]
MTVGLPGTGIGGIFYLLLAICMPAREFIRTLKGKTTLKRWGFITLQLLFVLGVISAMWGEVWLLNGALIWTWGVLKVSGPVLMASQSFSDTKVLALFSAYMSFISLAFVITAMHVLRFFVRRSRPTFGRTGYVKRLIKPKSRHARVISKRRTVFGVLTPARG